MFRKILGLLFLVTLTTACSVDQDGTSPSGSVTQQTKDVSGKIALAVGGNGEGRDIYQMGESPRLLNFTTTDTDLFTLALPEGYSSYTESRSVRITPNSPGIGYITPIVDSRERQPVLVTIPPQKLIQILVGEARGQIKREATLDENEAVKPESVSRTGDALGAVIRNRIELINESENPALFKADTTRYQADPPFSYYEAVIEAEGQFASVDPENINNKKYQEAADRTAIRDDDDLIAYDQAVLTAADIFNDATKDPTEGAFAFYTPTVEQQVLLLEALETGVLTLPKDCGASDEQFPELAPVQVLLLKDIASITSRDPRPSFVFVRERSDTEPAVTDIP